MDHRRFATDLVVAVGTGLVFSIGLVVIQTSQADFVPRLLGAVGWSVIWVLAVLRFARWGGWR